LNNDDCSTDEKQIYSEVRNLLKKLKTKEIAANSNSPMSSGILDLMKCSDKFAKKLLKNIQKALKKHQLDEIILPTEAEEMLDEFIANKNEGLKRVRPITLPNTRDMDDELEDMLYVTFDLLEAL